MYGIDTSTLTWVAPLIVVAFVGITVLRKTQKSSSARSMAASWPQTMGTVLSSTVQVSFHTNLRHENPLVLYAFQVNGQVFQGSRVRVGDEHGRTRVPGTDSSASNTVARYPAGTSVIVFYDPVNPANSALER